MPRIIQNGFMFHHLAYRYTPVESVSGPASATARKFGGRYG
jgi:hypothetical protein